jgi:hypothetical protein
MTQDEKGRGLGSERLRFVASRLNDTAWVELWEGNYNYGPILTEEKIPRSQWDEAYETLCREADRLNAKMKESP